MWAGLFLLAMHGRALAQPPGVMLYDPVPMSSMDPYAIQQNGYFSQSSPLEGFQSGMRSIANPVPYRGRMFLRGEYLGWIMDPMSTPALVTASTPGTPRNQAGFLGSTRTRTLFGGDINDEFRNGVRVQGGWFVDPSRFWSIGGDYYQLFSGGDSFTANETTNSILGRPFYDIVAGRESAQIVAFPAVATGEVNVDTNSQLRSFGINIRADAYNAPGAQSQLAIDCGREPRVDWLLGYRNVSLDDRIVITENIVSLIGSAPGSISLQDSFATENRFQGIEFGAIREVPLGRFWFETVTKVAVGSNAQRVTIRGATELTEAGVADTFPGGLLAQRSNIGIYDRNEFSVVPELGATLGFHVSPRFSLTVGYTLVYFSNVVRAGGQIDRDVNPGLIPVEDNPLTGPLRPQFRFRNDSFYATGITVGGDFRF